MELRWFGAILIILGCGGVGFCKAAGYRREEKMLSQMFSLITEMENELQYRLTPLPELCRRAGRYLSGPLKNTLEDFVSELEQRTAPDAASCMTAALSRSSLSGKRLRALLLELGRSLGRFDLSGQMKGLGFVKQSCLYSLEDMRTHYDERIRSYKTLGICAGLSLAILFL